MDVVVSERVVLDNGFRLVISFEPLPNIGQ